MQAKQKSLLGRVDALDEECEELQKQLGKSEERQINLHKQLQQMSEEKEQLWAQLTQQQVYLYSFVPNTHYFIQCSLCGASLQQDLCFELQKEKQTLETHVGELKDSVAELKEYVQSLRETERLLVAFPELSPLAHAQPQSRQFIYLHLSYLVFLRESSTDVYTTCSVLFTFLCTSWLRLFLFGINTEHNLSVSKYTRTRSMWQRCKLRNEILIYRVMKE